VLDFLNDDFVRRFRIGLVEHNALVTGALHDGRKRHDANRRKAHDSDVAIFGASFGGQGVELRIPNVNKEY
jgi:hypothetical protein